MMEQFPQFDVVSNFSDHFYANFTSNMQAAATKAVMKEWKILQKNLPAGSIYVRAYEGRVDLLRAVIIGPQKTPYHDGLFFFDFMFPANYPHAPPKAHYRAFGLRLNPNLYEHGKVCLSALNTWYGPKEARWQPGISTMLQVLVSIQALVLNDSPFHNEPALVLRLGSKSASYNDTAFMLTWKTMLSLLRSPPKNFEKLLELHVRARARAILTACQVYLNGLARVGDYEHGDVNANGPFNLTSEKKQRVRVSSDLESSLKEQYKMLLGFFAKYDPSLIEFSKELDLMVDNALKNSLPPQTMIKLFLGKLSGWMGCMDVKPKSFEVDHIYVARKHGET